MAIARGILVDGRGNFLGAFQWDDTRPTPEFNLPKRGPRGALPIDRKTLLPESVAERGMEFKRWNFRTKAWIDPDKKGWLVDERGTMRGSRRYFSDHIPNIPIGWVLTEKVPLKKKGEKAYFDRQADEWKFPLHQARVENDTLMNIECIAEGYVPPRGVEYIDPPTLLADGELAPVGAKRDGNGDWSVPLPPVPGP